MALTVRRLISKKDVSLFIDFPRKIYRNDPYWIRPSASDMEDRLSPSKNPFFEHCEVQLLLCEKDGSAAARAAVILDTRYNEIRGEKAAFFGFFESTDDPEVAAALLSACADWAREKGCRFLRGPVNPDGNGGLGLLVEGFDASPAFGTSYNPRAYADLVEKSGFKKEKDILAYHFPVQAAVPAFLKRAAAVALKESRLRVRAIDMKKFDLEMEDLLEIRNQSRKDQWGFVAMTNQEIRRFIDEIRSFAVPSLIVVVEAEGKPVAFSLALPDFNQVLKRFGGLNFLAGPLAAALGKNRITAGRLLGVDAVRKYDTPEITALLYLRTLEEANKLGYVDAEISWILEDDRTGRVRLEKSGASVSKTWRLYRKDL